jgi:hypothetical protein
MGRKGVDGERIVRWGRGDRSEEKNRREELDWEGDKIRGGEEYSIR